MDGEKTAKTDKIDAQDKNKEAKKAKWENRINKDVANVKEGKARAVNSKTIESQTMAEIISQLDWAMSKMQQKRNMASPATQEKYDNFMGDYIKLMISMDDLAVKVCSATDSYYHTPTNLAKRQRQIAAEEKKMQGTTETAEGKSEQDNSTDAEGKTEGQSAEVLNLETKPAKAKKAAAQS